MNTSEEKTMNHPRCGRRHLWRIPFFVLGILLFKSAVAMVLWNHLVPDIFHGPTLNYLQTFGLMILAMLFFGHGHGFRSGRGGFGHHRDRHWQKMTPEERLKLREEMRNRWAHCDKPAKV